MCVREMGNPQGITHCIVVMYVKQNYDLEESMHYLKCLV